MKKRKLITNAAMLVVAFYERQQMRKPDLARQAMPAPKYQRMDEATFEAALHEQLRRFVYTAVENGDGIEWWNAAAIVEGRMSRAGEWPVMGEEWAWSRDALMNYCQEQIPGLRREIDAA